MLLLVVPFFLSLRLILYGSWMERKAAEKEPRTLERKAAWNVASLFSFLGSGVSNRPAANLARSKLLDPIDSVSSDILDRYRYSAWFLDLIVATAFPPFFSLFALFNLQSRKPINLLLAIRTHPQMPHPARRKHRPIPRFRVHLLRFRRRRRRSPETRTLARREEDRCQEGEQGGQ